MKAILAKSPIALSALYSGLVAFCLYSCMYAFRKPFTAASFEGIVYFGLGYKSWLIISQLIGYTFSKFYGIKFISGLDTGRRWLTILMLILSSWLCLGLFALVPPSLGILCLFLNGVPLGMIWGLVFSYLEGRRTTELAGALLCSSFIFSSGMVKSVGKGLMNSFGIGEFAMPFAVGLVFLIPLILSLILIEQIPPPSALDVQLRSQRSPMNAVDRKNFLRQFLPGLVLLVIAYCILTILRDLRDNFAAEVWKENGLGNSAVIFTQAELPATFIVLSIMGALILIKNNLLAFRLNLGLIILGMSISLVSSLLFKTGTIPVQTWMILLGVGLYMSYVPFNCILFERLMATFRSKGNSGFAIYIADSFGYLGSMGILVVKETGGFSTYWTGFLTNLGLWMSIPGIVCIRLAALYFERKQRSSYPI